MTGLRISEGTRARAKAAGLSPTAQNEIERILRTMIATVGIQRTTIVHAEILRRLPQVTTPKDWCRTLLEVVEEYIEAGERGLEFLLGERDNPHLN